MRPKRALPPSFIAVSPKLAKLLSSKPSRNDHMSSPISARFNSSSTTSFFSGLTTQSVSWNTSECQSLFLSRVQAWHPLAALKFDSCVAAGSIKCNKGDRTMNCCPVLPVQFQWNRIVRRWSSLCGGTYNNPCNIWLCNKACLPKHSINIPIYISPLFVSLTWSAGPGHFLTIIRVRSLMITASFIPIVIPPCTYLFWFSMFLTVETTS